MELQRGTRPDRHTPPPRYSETENRADRHIENDDSDSVNARDEWSVPEDPDRSSERRNIGKGDLLLRLCAFIGTGWTMGLYLAYPAPTTVPLFIGIAFVLASWTIMTWTRPLKDLIQRKDSISSVKARFPMRFRIGLGLATALVLWWTLITVFAGTQPKPPIMIGNGEKYFIAVNFHNNEAILHDFIKELTLLIFHRKSHCNRILRELTTSTVGRHDLFVSVYESNSWDQTQTLLHGFNQSLSDLNVRHRILTVDNDPGSQWPYGTSPERIQFLAHARNMALEPLQSSDDSIRLSDWREYTKVIFLNDIVFRWQDIVDLITTRLEGKEEQDFDVACAMDFGSSGNLTVARHGERKLNSIQVCMIRGSPGIYAALHFERSGHLQTTKLRNKQSATKSHSRLQHAGMAQWSLMPSRSF
jgi:hypothetical protein